MLRRYVSRRQLLAEWFHEAQAVITIILAGALVIVAFMALVGCAWMISRTGNLGGTWNTLPPQGTPPVLPSGTVSPSARSL